MTPYLGQLLLASWNFPPKGFAGCNGQLQPINQNQALFSLLGTTYGGDGRTTTFMALYDMIRNAQDVSRMTSSPGNRSSASITWTAASRKGKSCEPNSSRLFTPMSKRRPCGYELDRME